MTRDALFQSFLQIRNLTPFYLVCVHVVCRL